MLTTALACTAVPLWSLQILSIRASNPWTRTHDFEPTCYVVHLE